MRSERLENIIDKLCIWIKPRIYLDQIKDIHTMYGSISTLMNQIEQKDLEIKGNLETLKNLDKRVDELKSKIDEIDEFEEFSPKFADNPETCLDANYWNNKREMKDITYKGRHLPLTKKMIDVPVQCFIQTNDPVIISKINDANLRVINPYNCNSEIMNIYKYTRRNFLYQSDDKTSGVNEYWFLPFELRAKKAGDCDDWGTQLASYLITAGVPSYRVRCVCGKTNTGFGHYTVYVLADDQKTWYHLNSTTSITSIRGKRLTQMPKSNNKADRMGIKEVWFSFNDKYAWNEFETSFVQDDFDKMMPRVNIK